MTEITLQDIREKIKTVEALTTLDGRKAVPEDLEEAYEIVGNIAYPSNYHIARLLDLTVAELEIIISNEAEVKYEFMKFKDFCLQYQKDRALRNNTTAIISSMLKEDFAIGADDKELINMNIIDPTKHTIHNDDIAEYDEAEEEFEAEQEQSDEEVCKECDGEIKTVAEKQFGICENCAEEGLKGISDEEREELQDTLIKDQ